MTLLTAKFTFVHSERDGHLGSSTATASTRIKDFIDAGMVKKLSRGHYQKLTNAA